MAAPRLVIVTATTNVDRAQSCIASWTDRAIEPIGLSILFNGGAHGSYLGTVPAFRRAIDEALTTYPEAEVFACLHDDLEIDEIGWDQKVLRHVQRQPACGLLGFGGAIGLGDSDIYQKPYAPSQLARIGFRSNLRDAELHGMRSLFPERVACLDGFSQVGRRAFWAGWRNTRAAQQVHEGDRPWHVLSDLGFTHHFYDGALGCLAARRHWEVWYLPVACHHYGGRTAVGDPGYQAWAQDQIEGGDHGFWTKAHEIGYAAFRDVLPLRV